MRGAWSLYSACTITCTSLRSGSASRGVRLSAHTPPAIAPAVKSSTMSWLATDHAMILFSMAASRFLRGSDHPRHVRHRMEGGAKVRLRIYQERGRGHDRLTRSEEHTSELQSRQYLVCRLLLE